MAETKAELYQKYSFYHYIISSWIRTNPEKFMEIVKKYKSWIWLEGKPVFIQMEWRHPKTLLFYDIYMKVKAPYKYSPDKFRYYHIFVEIKTGKYIDSWGTQLEKEYENRSSSKLGYTFDDYPQLLFIAKKSELSKFKQKLGNYPTSYLLFFELDYLEPHIQHDLKSLLVEVAF